MQKSLFKMDVVGSEIGQKMRSAIKAKLTELGCYVDDELPDYVMVMVANKRTRAQMEEDLQLFLGDNTELFVNWLHQVLKKLQEVTVPPIKPEIEKKKEKTKEKKAKDKKDKDKTRLKKVESLKKAKKKDKEKDKVHKKEEKKSHKHKKKSKHHEIIRPNIPPLLMNMEKESEPSITDVFAGQILKNHGILIESPKEEKPEKKPIIREIKKSILPIIDPATISSQPETTESATTSTETTKTVTAVAPREDQIKEMNEIEAKIQGLKQKLAEQLDSMSEDEDFLNIRTEAEELMNDFAEDVFQEISSQAPPVTTATPPATPKTSAPEPKSPDLNISEDPKEPIEIIEPPKPPEPETLPQIELNLPKRPVRERLGAKEDKKKNEETQEKHTEVSAKEKKRLKSPERFTPEKEPDFWGKYKSARSRLGSPPEATRKSPITFKRRASLSNSDDSDSSPQKKEKKPYSRVSCASVVRVKPRPRAPASSLLLRAMADAHKSLLNIPPKVEKEPPKIKRALVHPMRRCLDGQNIVIQIPAERPAGLGTGLGTADEVERPKQDSDKEEHFPSLSRKIVNSEYKPSRSPIAPLSRSDQQKRDDPLIESINIHNPTVDKDKNTQFIVTMDGFNPNAFLAKKLKTEGLLEDETELLPKASKSVLKLPPVVIRPSDSDKTSETKEVDKEKVDDRTEEKNKEKRPDKKDTEKVKEKRSDKKDIEIVKEKGTDKADINKLEDIGNEIEEKSTDLPQKKRLSDTSDDSDTQVIIKPEDMVEKAEKRIEALKEESVPKKRKASPIVFDVVKKEKEVIDKKRERTESASSDNHVTVTTVPKTPKYDTVPPLSAAPVTTEKKSVWCRTFPSCRYGALCAFQHPRCKFAAACTRRNCPYSHTGVVELPHAPTVASHVVPSANFKSVSRPPVVCLFGAACSNPSCHFSHPRPCRYGRDCADKLHCNFYHPPPTVKRYPL